MKILKAQINDIPEIIAIQKLAFYEVAKFYNNFKLRPLQTTIIELESSFANYIYFKAVIDKNIVGSVRIKINNNYCKIENLVVHPNFQRKGIGTELIKNIEQKYKTISEYELFTGKDTPGNVSFYEKLGYSIIQEIEATDIEPVLVIMKKKCIK